MLKAGDKSTCSQCGKAIQFDGKYWLHATPSPRHIATPIDSLITVDTTITCNFKPTLFSVGNFVFNQDKTSAKLNIQEDVTPLESANLSVMFAQASVATQFGFGWIDYIIKKKLARHFIIQES